MRTFKWLTGTGDTKA